MTEPIRIYCDDQEYPEAFIEYRVRFAQSQIDAAGEAAKSAREDDKYWVVRYMATACHIPTVGEPITDPREITAKRVMSDCEPFIQGWLDDSLPTAVAQRRVLGKVSARPSSHKSEIK